MGSEVEKDRGTATAQGTSWRKGGHWAAIAEVPY